MHDEAGFQNAMLQQPDDLTLRLVFADWLEEQGDPRSEVLRLLHALTQSFEVSGRRVLEDRLRGLLTNANRLIGPFFTNSLGMEFVWVPSGKFVMGSPETEVMRCEDETQHKVTLSRGFWLATNLVTQSCWCKVMESNPSHFRGNELPVEDVSWEDCEEFIRRLTAVDGNSYRLPTEAEWEYGCRSGTTTPFFYGETISTDQANFDGTAVLKNEKKGILRGKTTPVRSFPPNGWGVFDMHGNLSEWCADWYESISENDVVDPQGPVTGKFRIARGGAYTMQSWYIRAAFRGKFQATFRARTVGFRPVMV